MALISHRLEELPGWELVSQGLEDLAGGRASIEAALLMSASLRLRRLGFELPAAADVEPGLDLYRLVAAEVGDQRAHARYNALRRRFSSFLRAAQHASPR